MQGKCGGRQCGIVGESVEEALHGVEGYEEVSPHKGRVEMSILCV